MKYNSDAFSICRADVSLTRKASPLQEKTWHEAQANCMEMGMTLASIHNEQDQIAVMEASRGNGGWVGLTDDDHDAVNDHCPGAPGCGSSVSTTEGEWVFTDGTVIGNMDEARHWTPREGAFHNWAAGEPGDSSVGEDCAYLKVGVGGLFLACVCSSIGISPAATQGTRSSTVCDMGAHTVSQQTLRAPFYWPLTRRAAAQGCWNDKPCSNTKTSICGPVSSINIAGGANVWVRKL